jgi:phage terminase large subunit
LAIDSTLRIETPRWAVPLFQPARYKAAHGGRGSGKSHFFAEMLIEEHIMNPNRRTVCVREVQKSLAQSVKRLLEDKIEKLGVQSAFIVQETVIKSAHGSGMIIFQGMQNHTSDSIKSLEGYDCAWVEEAQSLSQRSLDLLRPTIRKEGSELWFTWNPSQDTDPVDQLLHRCSMTGRPQVGFALQRSDQVRACPQPGSEPVSELRRGR